MEGERLLWLPEWHVFFFRLAFNRFPKLFKGRKKGPLVRFWCSIYCLVLANEEKKGIYGVSLG